MAFSDPPLQAFFAKIDDIKTDLTSMRTKQRFVQQMHEKSKTIVKAKEMQRSREEMRVGSISHIRFVCVCTGQCLLCLAASANAPSLFFLSS